MSKKSLWFWRSLPWLVVFLLVAPFVRNFCRAQFTVDPDVEKQVRGWDWIYTFEDENGMEGVVRTDRTLIYVFGGSSVVLSDNHDRDPSRVFPRKLQQQLEPRASVINLGREGVDSHYVRDKVYWSCDQVKPDLIVLYLGHNDYTNAYQRFVRPHYSILRDSVFTLLLRAQGKDVYWLVQFAYDPLAQDLLARLRLWRVDEDVFRRYEYAVEDRFSKNLNYVIRYARCAGIKVVLMTPVSNLDKPPVANRSLREAFESAQREEDYDTRMAKLLAVRDADYLSPDARARSGILNLIRNTQNETEGVFVLDLERELLQRRYSFSTDMIMDAFHHNEVSHELIGRLLAEFLEKRGLVSERQPTSEE